LKIAIVRSTLNKGSGQVVHIRELAYRLMDLGHQVTVFSRDIKEHIGRGKEREIRFTFDKIPFIRHFGFATICGKIIRDYDIVHTQYHPGIFVGNYVNFINRIPHVFTYHGFAPVNIWVNPFQKIKMVDHRVGTFFALRLGVNQIIPVSHYLENELKDFYKFPKERLQVIYNGVDVDRFNPKIDSEEIRIRYGIGESPLVVFVGRLALYKGAHFLIRAIPYILKEVPKTKFLITGAARFDSIEMGKLILNSKIRNSLIFTGYVSNEDIPKIYSACDVFCYPSLWEGFGLTPAEAQACGKPVVAFNHCAIPEVVENKKTGILVRPRDFIMLAKAISFLLLNESEREKMGLRARERVEKLFSWERTAIKTLSVYKKVLEN
jgi:glycosyltransferase involved in cell wall biosynthesis